MTRTADHEAGRPFAPELLECTIRDGSYAIGFKWSEDDVGNLVGALAEAGFRHIEIGHGLGLGGGRTVGQQAGDDEVHAQAAAARKGAACLGAFFIPGIGTRDDMRRFRDDGGDFIRVATNVSDSHSALPFVGYARELGFTVCFNFMKSYLVAPYELCRRAIELEEAGATVIYVVDSAGGMAPEEVGHYVLMMRECLRARIGFHGHNNLLLANANALSAARAGASLVDTTLLGLGRGAGNAQTEALLVAMEKMGYQMGIDPLVVAAISERCIRPKGAAVKGVDRRELALGQMLFHSGYVPIVERYAAMYGVEAEDVIRQVAAVNNENPSEELIGSVAEQLGRKKKVEIFFPKFYHKEVK